MKRKYIAEWIPHLEMYRLYDPEHPNHTVAYESTREEISKRLDEERGDMEVTYDESRRANG